jgi:DNA-binding NarL/FixJ family response regulator
MSIRVVVADDFPLIRAGLVDALRTRADIEVVAEARDGIEAIEMARRHRPDVLLLDLTMPRLGGLEALTVLREEAPDVRVLVVTASERRDKLVEAVSAGAAGYLTKRSSVAELCDAVANVHAGEGAISPSLTVHLLSGLSGDRAPAADLLSPRELEVLRLVAHGHTDAEISARLSIAQRTVQAHLARVRDKTGLRRRGQLAIWASENDLL